MTPGNGLRTAAWLPSALLPAVLLPSVACAQVVQIAGGVANVAGAQGGTIGLYQSDTTTRLNLGYADGMRFGVSRAVQMDHCSLVAGDSVIALSLPTDLQDAPRVFNVRGALFHMQTERSGMTLFAGWSGTNYANAFFSTVAPMHPLTFASGNQTTGKVNLSGAIVRGEQSSALLSAAWSPALRTMLAATVGRSSGAWIGKVAVLHEAARWRLDASYTQGRLQLQPETTLANLNLERIGLNVMAQRRFWDRLTLDAARHEYSTAGVSADPLWKGVDASRSQLMEAGATLRLGHFESGGRLLHSTSGSTHSDGSALIGGWNERLWNVRVTSARSSISTATQPAPTGTRTTFVDAAEQVHPRLRVLQSAGFGGGSPSFDFGGMYEGNRGSISVAHREAFVPFGSQAGFRRFLLLSIRLNIRDSQAGFDSTSGGGLPATYAFTTAGYYGQEEGMAVTSNRMPQMPRYLVRGRVIDASKAPVRGAAVLVGDQLVFTDSDGDFSARFKRNAPVRLVLDTKSFLTDQSYRGMGGPLSVVPAERNQTAVVMQVEVCRQCQAQELAAEAAKHDAESEQLEEKSMRARLIDLTRRMVRIRSKS